MARIFVSFVHEEEKVALAMQEFLQKGIHEEVFLSSDKSHIYAGDYWLKKIEEGLTAAQIVILMLSKRSVARPWVNFEAGAAWLTHKTIIPVCYGHLSREPLPHPYSAIQRVDLPLGAPYLMESVNHHLGLEPINWDALVAGMLSGTKSGLQDDLAKVLAEFNDL